MITELIGLARMVATAREVSHDVAYNYDEYVYVYVSCTACKLQLT